MKKFLSIVLALMMVLMPTVWAAPAMQNVESATEDVAVVETAEEKADLADAPKTLKPGLNILTGTTDLLDAEGEDAKFTDFSDVFVIDSVYDSSKFAIIDNPDKNSINNTDKAFSLPLKVQSGTGEFYHGFQIQFNPAIENRPIYTTYKIQKLNTGEHVSKATAWIMSDNGGYGIVKTYTLNTNTGWLDVTGLYDYDKTQYAPANNGTISWLKIHFPSNNGNVTPTTVIVDELGFYPSYKVTYMDPTGTDVIATEHVLLDDSGNFLTDYYPEAKFGGAYYYPTWSTSIGGEVVESVKLANEDIVLYASSSEVQIDSVTADKTTLDYVGETANVSAVLGDAKTDYTEKDITWSVEGTSIMLNATNGANISVTAIGDGKSTVTANVGGAYKSIEFNVVEAFDIGSTVSYVTPSTSAVVSLDFKNGYSDADTITWTINDEASAATLAENGDGTVTVSSKSGNSGVVNVTATLDSNTNKKKTIALYVSGTDVDSDTKMIVNKSATSITENLGIVLVDAKVFSTDTSVDRSVKYTIDDISLARIVTNLDGTATVEAIKDGTVNVTVTANCDADLTETFAITISSQREKYASYSIKYLAFGNSFLDHGPYDGWPWEDPENGNRGMAASRVELDYFNRTVYHLTHGQSYYANVDATKGGNASGWESKLADYTLQNAAAQSVNDSRLMIDKIKAEKPNLITVQLAENVRQMDPVILALAYDAFYAAIKEAAPENCIIMAITPFFGANRSDPRTCAVIDAATKAGFLVNDMSFVSAQGSGRANPYYAFDQYHDAPTVNAFGSHPGDWGMDQIALRNVAQINTVLTSKLTPEYIYLPEAFEIDGTDSITKANGTAKYSIVSTPADASKDATWSVDNTNIATITQNGILTAVNDGTVEITVKSAYNDAVIATKTVTISGQTPCYTVSYAAGADDESVDGLPESFTYAKGKYVLSNVVPTRDGYQFVGWALKPNGTVVSTVNVTENTTVYAVWTFADSWEFDMTGNFEALKTFGLFNERVENGIYTGISYGSEDGMYVYNDTLLIKTENYTGFRFKALMTANEAGKQFAVKITTTDKEYDYTFDVNNNNMNEYSVDISNYTGIITGFKITPVVGETTLKIDEIEFVRLPGEDELIIGEADMVIDGNGERCFYGTIEIADGASVILKNGIFHVDNFTGNTNAITTIDANLITNDVIPGYAVIDLGEKADEAYTRFVQIDGYTYAVRERDNTVGLAFPEEKIVVVTTKNGDTLIDCNYYCINNGSATLVDVFSNSFNTTTGASMRADENTGIRYRASITNEARDAEEFAVVEYGFIMARQDQLIKNNAQLNFDFKNVAYGAAYLKNDNNIVVKDNVFQMDDTNVFFTGVAINIPVAAYTSVLSARPYMKIKSANGVYTVYGEVVSRSIYQVARSILADASNGLSEEEIEVVKNIINSVQPDNESFVDIGGLFNI